MAAYYPHHPHTHATTDPDHLHHTLFLMNPNFAAPSFPNPPPPPPPSHNILLLNSMASASAGPTQQGGITLYGYTQQEAPEIARPRQGLSLSLNPPYRPQPDGDVVGGGAGPVLGSKYLRAAQELLEEVVHVGQGLLSKTTDSTKKGAGAGFGPGSGESSEDKHSGGDGGGGDGGSGSGVQLSSAERQELQMKKAKLMNMLDEAEQRYRQYHSQMQIVIASFEQAAGTGTAKAYTALALKTISRQFRCLKDAIQAQIKAASRSLGEDEAGLGSSGGKLEGSRLKYIDHQIRQQRALQQLGMIQNHNAWRPQRGLPERSVSVLRAWLFEHFLHPYPKDSDKIMLAKQTGLTRSQVSNWFINARVRLWKPMIEEMYKEEIKEQEPTGSEDKASGKENRNESNSALNQEKINNSIDQNQNNPSSPSSISFPTNFKGINNSLPQSQHGFAFSGSLEMEGISQGSPKRPRNDEVLHCGDNNREIFIKFGNDKQGRDHNGYPMISGAMNFVGAGEGLESYPTITELGRFGAEEFAPTRFVPGNGISLSLGLPPCENQQQQLNLSATSHTFLSPNQSIHFRRPNDFGSMVSPSPHSSAAAFECIDIQNRKGFAAQLLPDFVA